MTNDLVVLGVHGSFNSLTHDPSACLAVNGELVAAVEEERLNRNKTSSGFFPERAISKCLEVAGLDLRDVNYISSDGSSFPALEKKIRRYMSDYFGLCPPVLLQSHPACHLASAFYGSSFDEALCVSVDGIGDKISTSVEVWRHDGRTNLYQAGDDGSLGLFYTAFTNYLGFKSIEGEYKVMGMAAYGSPRFDLSDFIRFDTERGVINFNTSIYESSNYSSIWEPSYIEDKIFRHTGVLPRGQREKRFAQEHFDLAASVQLAFERAYLSLISYYLDKSGQRNVALAGGCALNCLANKRLLELTDINSFVFPAASDRGLSIGAAFLAMRDAGVKPKKVNDMYLGPEYSDDEIGTQLSVSGLRYRQSGDVAGDAAKAILSGKIIGWHQGRSEFGPRALGNRSIIASASLVGSKDLLNKKIKFREAYRPFAPAILEEDLFIVTGRRGSFPYMTFAQDVLERGALMEAVNVDGTARFQTVSSTHRQPRFRSLLENIKRSTGIGVVINTSFNLAGEPIVETPADALRTFVSSGLDELFIGSWVVTKV